jgi:hypothetical protein
MVLAKKDSFCIFCGERPTSKSKEHVLPQWLLKLTGDPKRQLIVGPFLSKLDEEAFRKQSFDSLHFPACEVCNNRFSSLEAVAKSAIEKLLAEQPLSAKDFHCLLDWLDKVRVGLWLGFHQYLDKNIHGIKPRFYIAQRIGLLDRTVLIAATKERRKGLHSFGVQTPAFAYMPSCFALIVNGYALFNVSENLVLGEGLGLPRLKETILVEGPQIAYRVEPGTDAISTPVLRVRPMIQGTRIHQPNFPAKFMADAATEMYTTEHVRSLFDSVENGTGKVLLEKHGRVVPYPHEPSGEWLPERRYSLSKLLQLLPECVLRMQNALIDRHLERASLGDEGQDLLEQLRHCKQCNEVFLEN